MKILGFVRAQIKKVKKNFLYGEAAKVYKRNGTARRGQLQHCSFSACTVKITTAMQAELTKDI